MSRRAVAALVSCVSLLVAGTSAGAERERPRWASDAPLPLWIEAPNVPARHRDLVRRAMRAWCDATDGVLRYREVAELPLLGIRVRFVNDSENFGETLPHEDERSGRIVRADILVNYDFPGDPLKKQLVLYLTALHELGHALGLPHSDNWGDIMYRFRRSTDSDRVFFRYRQSLRSEEDIGSERTSGLGPGDERAIRRLYGGAGP